MMTISAGQPLVDLTKACYRANTPLLIEGRHGVGKSELLEQAARALGIKYIVRDLALMEPVDLVGIPRTVGKRTQYFPPKFLPDGGAGLLVFEELNRAGRAMQAPCLQLLSARILNDYRLPERWLPVAAINPPEVEGYDVVDLDLALQSRFLRVRAKPDRDLWLTWARGQKLHADVIAYAESDTSIFDHPESNPRSWKYASDFLLANAEKTPQHLLQVGVSGFVGEKRAGAFFRFVKDRVKALTAEQILKDYHQHRAEVRGWVRGGKLDLVKESLWALQTLLQAEHNFKRVRRSAKSWENVGRFLYDLPGDLAEQAERFFDEHGYPRPERRSK